MKISLESVVLGLVSLPGVIAWGDLGHETTAYIASYFVSNSTAAYLKGLLHNNDDDYLARIAMFADIYKHTNKGSFTKNWHFIDAHDGPSDDCNVNYARDCKKGGCIISALSNYTEQALDRELPDDDRQFAVKLLVHFIGDLHQPLHNEDVKKGGTEITVKWQSHTDNLHAVWDSSIPEKVAEHLQERRKSDLALKWASELVDEISNGKFATGKNYWLENFDLSDPNKTAMAWSMETNKLVCTHVFPMNYKLAEIKHKELSNEYYNQAGPIVEEEIARAGFRMAAWLDEIARTNWGGKDNSDTTEEL